MRFELARVVFCPPAPVDLTGLALNGRCPGAETSPFDGTSAGGGHGVAITRTRVIRSTTRSARPNVGVRNITLNWEPPIGIEPMTYALRGGLEASTAVQMVTAALLV